MGKHGQDMIRLPLGVPPSSRRDWPVVLRWLYYVAVAGLLLGLAQAAYWLSSDRPHFDRPRVQAAYVTVGQVLIVACVAAGAAARRRAFGALGLATAAFHLCVTSWFNFEIAASAGATALAPLRVFDRWDTNAGVFCWNWMVIAIDAAICFYLLRYEAPLWRSGATGEPAGFDVAPPA